MSARRAGVRGNQGVLLPRSNIQHLLPRPDVVAAMTAGDFHLYPVDSVDEAIEILTGIPAGTVDGRGDYPPETVNGRVLARLKQFAERRGAFARGALPRGEFRRPGRSRHKTSWEK